MTAVRNRCRDVLNRKSMQERVEKHFLQESMQSQIVSMNDDDRLERLMQFIEAELPPLSQQIFRLRFLSEMSYEGVAQAAGVSKVTVYNHLSQSLQRIKEYFQKETAKWFQGKDSIDELTEQLRQFRKKLYHQEQRKRSLGEVLDNLDVLADDYDESYDKTQEEIDSVYDEIVITVESDQGTDTTDTAVVEPTTDTAPVDQPADESTDDGILFMAQDYSSVSEVADNTYEHNDVLPKKVLEKLKIARELYEKGAITKDEYLSIVNKYLTQQ